MTHQDVSMPRAPDAFFVIARRELLLLWRDRSLPIVVLLLSALLLAGLADGSLRVSDTDAQLAAGAARRGAEKERVAQQLKAAEAGGTLTGSASPLTLLADPETQIAIMPTLALAPLALGQSDLRANSIRLDVFSDAQLLSESDIANPWHLAVGHFDVGFVVVFLLPLLVFGMSYDLLSADRERGTARLLHAQSASPVVIACGKAAARAAALAVPLLSIPLVVLLPTRVAENGADFAADYLLWSAIVLVYGSFWLSLAVLVNSFGRSSAANAIALVGAWVVLTLVIPISLNFVVETVHPTPSRAAMIEVLSEAMEAAARHSTELDRVVFDVDPLAPKDGKFSLPPTVLRMLNMQKEITEAMSPWQRAFDANTVERQGFVETYRIWSPAATAYDGMTGLAGTDAGRYERLFGAAAAFFRDKVSRIRPRLMNGTAVTEAELRAAPRFVWTEGRSETLGRAAWSLQQLAAPTVLIAALALWRLRRRVPI